MFRTGSGTDLKNVLAKVINAAVRDFKTEFADVRAQKL
jgi:hypothetical protein